MNQQTRRKRPLQMIVQSKFLRSIFFQTVLIFLIVIIAVIAIVSLSSTAEINTNALNERQRQLAVIEQTISKRLSEISSIAYNVGTDPSFYLESTDNPQTSDYTMSQTLGRYLVGNDFIEYLAYYRLAEPDTLYVSTGTVSFRDFWTSRFHMTNAQAEQLIAEIQSINTIRVVQQSFGDAGHEYFTYICPLPQFAKSPKAFVLVMIPMESVKPLLEAQLNNCSGQVAVFDADGNEIACVRNLDEELPMDLSVPEDSHQFSYDGKEYVLQKTVSPTNGWTFASVICLNEMVSGIATRQLELISLLLVLMLIAIVAMLACVVIQYRPINRLAASVKGADATGAGTLIDEKSLLSDQFAILKDDSAQKQKFETAYYEATAANQAKSAFLSNMSHDIRTPMNAILGMTEIAAQHAHNPEYVLECLQKVKIASKYLLDIINNVLDMSRIESGKFTLMAETVSLPELVYGVISILHPSIEAKGQRLAVTVGDLTHEMVIGDHVRLTQIFVNILSNSAKFTPNGGSIQLHLTELPETEAGYVDYQFLFSDTGVGMSPEFISHVFDTFSRDEQSSGTRVEGTGLGMAIVKSFVELMGGTIHCDSKLGEGTRFDVRLHLKRATGDDTSVDATEYPQEAVLILGEDETVCTKQVERFCAFGADAEFARSIPAALKLLHQAQAERQPYTVLLLHQTPADPAGVATITELRAAVDLSGCAVVLAAVDLFSIDQSAACDAGMTAFVQLPLFPSTARNILQHAFSPADAQEQIRIPVLEGVHIMLVEDNEMNRKIAQYLISETQADVLDATNGQEAVDLFTDHPEGYFDLILMDVQMPIMDGYTAASSIRALPRADAKTISIYAMTANTFDEDVRHVLESGMNGHLAKPYEAKKLYQVLEQVCANRRK